MKTHLTSIGLSLVVGLVALTSSSLAQHLADKGTESIGVYDSRAVAIACAGSIFQQNKMRDLTSQLKKAKESGDAKEVSRLEAEGKAWQAQLHRQGFGTAPVDDILTNIASELPKIQQTVGVTSLVSKWNKAEFDKHLNAERIDVTLQLIDAFHPSGKQRQYALDIQKKSPVKVKE